MKQILENHPKLHFRQQVHNCNNTLIYKITIKLTTGFSFPNNGKAILET